MPRPCAVVISRSQLRSSDQIEQLYRIGGEATAYYALALWRSLQHEELQKGLNRKKSNPDSP
jgi:hypothetical protein